MTTANGLQKHYRAPPHRSSYCCTSYTRETPEKDLNLQVVSQLHTTYNHANGVNSQTLDACCTQFV